MLNQATARGRRVRWRVADRRVRFPALACGGVRWCVEARPVSGARGSSAGARCAMRRGGSAITRLPSSPVAAASARPRVGRSLHFRKPAALPRDSSLSRVPRARPGHRRTSAFRRRRLACACGADAARCCRLAPPCPRIRRAMRPPAASVRLAGPRARSARPLHAPHTCNRKIFMRLWRG